MITLIIGIVLFIKPTTEKQSFLPETIKEVTTEEILQSLTVPSANGEEIGVSQKIMKSLTVPAKERETSEDILKSLTAPK